MLKKVNVILIFASIVLTTKLNIGYAIFLPVLLFYILKDIKNIYYAFIPSIIITVAFNREIWISLLVVLITSMILVYYLNNAKKYVKYSTWIISGYLLIIHVSMAYFLKISSTHILVVLSSSIISIILYLYLEKFLFKILENDQSIEQYEMGSESLISLAYLEIMVGILAVLGAAQLTFFEINFGFVIGVYFAMYMGRKYHNIYSLIYGILAMLLIYVGHSYSAALFIPFISTLYFISNVLLILALNVFLAIVIFSNTTYPTNALLCVMVLSIIFEVVQRFLIDILEDDKTVFEYIYDQVQKNTSSEILNFAVFLDKFSTSFQNPKEFNERLSDGIKSLVYNQCNSCPLKKECFNKYKIDLYNIFKGILLKEPNFRHNNREFVDYCPKINSLEHNAKMLESKLISEQEIIERAPNHILISQLTCVSNVIKKYVLELTKKRELSFYKIMLIKTRLVNFGYNVSYFEVCKMFEDDFHFKVGLQDVNFEDAKVTIAILCKSILDQEVSVIMQSSEGNAIYLNIVPHMQIDITYGYGALSCDGEDICGDNYLIKEIDNGHFISAISDGMGKGYRAFYESDMTLKLVEDIIKLNLDSTTSLEILNSFYTIQDYLEQYATLDFLEINRYNKTANFYKMGATTTYIFRSNGTIDKIINKSLPFGIEEEINVDTYTLENGDLILMTSDGIFENIIDEGQLEEFIKQIKSLPPQKIVYELLNYTINNKIKTKDDMSIIALKIQTT